MDLSGMVFFCIAIVEKKFATNCTNFHELSNKIFFIFSPKSFL